MPSPTKRAKRLETRVLFFRLALTYIPMGQVYLDDYIFHQNKVSNVSQPDSQFVDQRLLGASPYLDVPDVEGWSTAFSFLRLADCEFVAVDY